MNSVNKNNVKKMEPGYVGIDVGKKTLEICRMRDGEKIEWFKTATTQKGINLLLEWLRKGDVIAIEAGNQAFRIAKTIVKKVECKLLVLNPGDIAMIYQSMKKTDREDCLKLARLISRIPAEELPVVKVPSDETEDARRLLREHEYWNKQNTASKNRLHSLFVQDGLTHIRKKDLASRKNREFVVTKFSERFKEEAERMHQHIIYVEDHIKLMKVAITEQLKKDVNYTTIAMSMPGIGPISALTFMAFLGDCSRFSSPSQVSNYVGIVPRVDISGDTKRYGKITKRGAHLIRRPLIQAAWALVRSERGGDLKRFYERLYHRIGKGKAIVATARKMVEVFYAMIKSGELFRDVPCEEVEKKLSLYNVI